MDQQRKINPIIIIVVIVVVAVLALTVTFWKKLLPPALISQSETISPNILYLTQPITSFNGKIEKVDANSITVSQTVYSQTMVAAPAAQIPDPNAPAAKETSTPKSKTLTYKVIIGKNTSINKFPTTIPYLFKTSTLPTTNQPLTLKDLKAGQPVSITSNKDLRTLANNEFDALSITLQSSNATLNGKISEVKAGSIIIKTNPQGIPLIPQPNADKSNVDEKQIEVLIDQDTEISRNSFSVDPTRISKPERLTINDLKKDMQVNVYTEGNADNTSSVKALRIEPFTAPTAANGAPLIVNPNSSTPAAIPMAPPVVR